MSTLERLQQAANLVAAAEQALLAHAIASEAFEQFGAATTADLLVNRCHVRRSEAHARVRRAKRAEPRTTLTGELLPPRFERLSDAQAAGAVTADHVDVVTHWLTKIEPHTGLQQFTDIGTELVALSTGTSPDVVAARGREILEHLDPDGPAPRDLERRRAVCFRQDDDGAGTLYGSLVPEVLAMLQTLISPLAAPRPENAATGEKDRRGVAQRQHDAFEELLTRLLQTSGMPHHGGIPLTLVVMMDIDDLIARTGTARTAFGTTIPVRRLLEQAAELQVVPVITSKVDGVLAYGTNRRIASPGQALALIGRDRGCTFPGCQRPQQTNRLAVPAAPHPRGRRRQRRDRRGQPRAGLRVPPPARRSLGMDGPPRGWPGVVDATADRRSGATTDPQRRASSRRAQCRAQCRARRRAQRRGVLTHTHRAYA